jgi:hypothetical protein
MAALVLVLETKIFFRVKKSPLLINLVKVVLDLINRFPLAGKQGLLKCYKLDTSGFSEVL